MFRPAPYIAPRKRRAGMTLIEIMVVVVIIALAATGVVWGVGAITRTSLRSACMTFTAAARYAYNRSIARGTTVRLVFDMDEEKMHFEEAHGRVTLARVDDARRAEIEEAEEEEGDAVDPWAAAQARLGDVLRPSFGASPFTPMTGDRYQARQLAGGVRLERLTVPHEPE